VTAVYDAWCGLVEVHADLIKRIAARHNLEPERILRSSLLCVALHDVGKLSRNFQAMMRAKPGAEYKHAVACNYRHEIAALWLVDFLARELAAKTGPIPGGGLLETMAVAGHHRFLATDYLFDPDRFIQALSWEPDPWTPVSGALALAREMFHDRKWNFPAKLEDFDRVKEKIESQMIHDPSSGANPPYDLLMKCRKAVIGSDPSQSPKFRDLFLLLKGLLMTADWMASGAVDKKDKVDDLDAVKSVVRVGPGVLESHLRERVERKGKLFDGLKDFQKKCGEASGHVIAVAPTGSGKTEASWLWALNQVEQKHVKKVIILLPTMVTSNSIHERLREFFEELHGHQVGLVHSTADLVRSSKTEGDEADRADVRANLLSESHYFRPVTVGTVDQLLVPLFHAGRWAMKTFAAADAAIIIDEIHAYEPHTLGLITLMIEQLSALGARFMVMSATMPNALKQVIQEALEKSEPGVEPVDDPELLDSARNTWTKSDMPLLEYLLSSDPQGRTIPSRDFLDLWASRNDRNEPLKILIVVNTVKRCQELSKAFREFGFELTCYHSKFIFDHRREKESRINERPPRLLIATQVVEVSLDIDYDVLLTECAPIDALVQRAGRVNRPRRENLGRVVIHSHEEDSERIYGFPPRILDTTWGLLEPTQEPTERKLIELVEKAYEGFAPKDDEAYKTIRNIVDGIQGVQQGVLDCPNPYEDEALAKTRKDAYPQVSVIPEQFEVKAVEAKPYERKKYELKVPVWYAREHHISIGDGKLPICPMDYSDEFGAELRKTEKHPDPGSMIV
jgi:CRISPR-associated endonuclease/helicase Cas3